MPRRCHTVDSLSKCACCCLDRRDVLHGHIERDRDGSFISPQREGRNKEHGQREKAEGKEAEDLQEHIGTRRTWNIIRCAYCCYPTTSIRIPSTSTCISPSPPPPPSGIFVLPFPSTTHSLSPSLTSSSSPSSSLFSHTMLNTLSLSVSFLLSPSLHSTRTERERERQRAPTPPPQLKNPLLLSSSLLLQNPATER